MDGKEVKCGEVSDTRYNRGKKEASIEITVESSGSTGECKGVTLKFCDKNGNLVIAYYSPDLPWGPDRYDVPADGSVEFICGRFEDKHEGKCKVTYSCRWLS